MKLFSLQEKHKLRWLKSWGKVSVSLKDDRQTTDSLHKLLKAAATNERRWSGSKAMPTNEVSIAGCCRPRRRRMDRLVCTTFTYYSAQTQAHTESTLNILAKKSRYFIAPSHILLGARLDSAPRRMPAPRHGVYTTLLSYFALLGFLTSSENLSANRREETIRSPSAAAATAAASFSQPNACLTALWYTCLTALPSF